MASGSPGRPAPTIDRSSNWLNTLALPFRFSMTCKIGMAMITINWWLVPMRWADGPRFFGRWQSKHSTNQSDLSWRSWQIRTSHRQRCCLVSRLFTKRRMSLKKQIDWSISIGNELSKIAEDLDPIELRRLAFYIIDTVLDRPEQSGPPVVPLVNVPVISSLS